MLFLASLAAPADAAAQGVPNRVRWTVEVSAPPRGGPVAAGAALAIPLDNDTIAAHAVRDGALLWTAEIGATQPLAGDEARVYVPTADAIHAFSSATGHFAWRVALGGPPTAPPLAHAGWVIAAAAGELLAIRAADGAVIWRADVGAVEFRPSLDGDLLVVPIIEGRLLALDLPTGTPRWEVRLGSRPTEPLVIGGRVYVGTEDKWFHSLHASNGRRDWRKAGALPRGRATVDTRHIFFAAMDNVLRALDRGNGALRWNQALAYRPSAGPTVLAGLVVVPGDVESLPAFAARTGAAAGQIPFPARLARVPAFSQLPDGSPLVFGLLGDLFDRWTLTLLEGSLIPDLPVQPLAQVPGEAVPMPAPPAP